MGAREFEIREGGLLKLDPVASGRLDVRFGEVWVTRYKDPRDYVLKTGDSMVLDGKGATLAMAFKPTLLDLYRSDPVGTRERLEREARRARSQGVWALLRKVFRGRLVRHSQLKGV